MPVDDDDDRKHIANMPQAICSEGQCCCTKVGITNDTHIDTVLFLLL